MLVDTTDGGFCCSPEESQNSLIVMHRIPDYATVDSVLAACTTIQSAKSLMIAHFS